MCRGGGDRGGRPEGAAQVRRGGGGRYGYGRYGGGGGVRVAAAAHTGRVKKSSQLHGASPASIKPPPLKIGAPTTPRRRRRRDDPPAPAAEPIYYYYYYTQHQPHAQVLFEISKVTPSEPWTMFWVPGGASTFLTRRRYTLSGPAVAMPLKSISDWPRK